MTRLSQGRGFLSLSGEDGLYEKLGFHTFVDVRMMRLAVKGSAPLLRNR